MLTYVPLGDAISDITFVCPILPNVDAIKIINASKINIIINVT
jgi:hypothetical protein